MNELKPFTVVRAGAGAGKTYRIKEDLARWITEGRVQPERVMAVTYTEAAAAELRERVTAELLKKGGPENGLKLSRAYFSTDSRIRDASAAGVCIRCRRVP